MPGEKEKPTPTFSRRRFLQGGAMAAAGAAIGGCLSTEFSRILECAKGTACAGADLSSIQHIVMFMQENRSFDQYFGMLPGVRGFGDPTGLFRQPVPVPTFPQPVFAPIYPLVGYVLPLHTAMSEAVAA